MSTLDITLLDNNRIELTLLKSEIETILPEYFEAEYPKFVQLLNDYYEWMSLNNNFVHELHHLMTTRDITQSDGDRLPLIEDELLLGQSYFQGFTNKREAAKFSSTLYRSKGTKYSIEQFFRGFFNEDPEVIYPRDKVFTLNEDTSQIGPLSQKYITNNALYQTNAILIRTGLPRSLWEEVYKLFVHPAGMYLGSEVVLVGANEPISNYMPDKGLQAPIVPTYEGVADLISAGYGNTTSLVADQFGTNRVDRQDTSRYFNIVGETVYSQVENVYTSLAEFLDPAGLSFDRDHGDFSDEQFSGFDRSFADSDGVVFGTGQRL